jgi:hypothetical protein
MPRVHVCLQLEDEAREVGIRRADLAFAALVRLGRDGVTQEALQEELNLRAMRKRFRGGVRTQSFDTDEESGLITALAASVLLVVGGSRHQLLSGEAAWRPSPERACKRSIPDQDNTGGSLLMSEARLRTASAAIMGRSPEKARPASISDMSHFREHPFARKLAPKLRRQA